MISVNDKPLPFRLMIAAMHSSMEHHVVEKMRKFYDLDGQFRVSFPLFNKGSFLWYEALCQRSDSLPLLLSSLLMMFISVQLQSCLNAAKRKASVKLIPGLRRHITSLILELLVSST